MSWAITCCGGNRSEAEDVLQTAYLKIIDGRARFEERSSFKTWLFSVIRMTARETRRKAWLRGGLLGRWLDQTRAAEAIEAPESGRAIEAEEDRSRVLRALGGLSRRQREVLELIFYHDLTIAEAAITMGVSIGSARVHYERGKKGLRDALQKPEAGDE